MPPLPMIAALCALALAGSAAAASPDGGDQPYAEPAAVAHYLRARFELARGDEQRAAQEMELAIAFDPSSAALRAAAADLFLAVGNSGRARGEARRAVDLGSRSKDPDPAVRGHAVLGRIAAAEGRWKAAAAELGAAARLADAPPARGSVAPRALPPDDRFVLGVAQEAQRLWADAAATFAQLENDEDLRAMAALRQAHSLSRGRRPEEALLVLQRARAAGDVRFATMRAIVLGRAGRSSEAAAELRAQIAARLGTPPAADALARDVAGADVGELVGALGLVLVDAGLAEEAVAELRRGLALRPGDRDLVLRLATALERTGDVDGAAACALELLAEDADDVEALNFAGYLLADRGIRLDEAERLLVRAAELAPAESAVLDSLGWLWLRKGDTVRAIRTLERAESLGGPDATILEHLGDAYRAARRDADAVRAWRRALAEIDADPPGPAGEVERVRRQRSAISKKLSGVSPARAVR